MEPVNIVKEVLIDALILLFGLLVITAEGVATHASKGLSCGQEQAQIRAATPEEAVP